MSKKTEEHTESSQFINEVNQELHDERIVGLWKSYGRYIIAGAVAIVLGTAGVTGYNSYKHNTAKTEALRFETAIKNESTQALSTLALEGEASTQLLSTMSVSKMYVEKGDFAKASSALLVYANQTNEELYKQYALLASVWVRMQSGEGQNLLPVLDGIIASGFYKNLAQFSKVEILLSLNKKTDAKKLLSTLALDSTLTAQQREVVSVALLAIGQ